MKKFIVTYLAPVAGMQQAMGSMAPEEMQQVMKQWQGWFERCGDGIVDWGAPTGNSQTVTRSGATPSTSAVGVTGYSILQAESMEDALKMLENHPHFEPPLADESTIEIHEAFEAPGS